MGTANAAESACDGQGLVSQHVWLQTGRKGNRRIFADGAQTKPPPGADEPPD
jgi:hypothetical protein